MTRWPSDQLIIQFSIAGRSSLGTTSGAQSALEDFGGKHVASRRGDHLPGQNANIDFDELTIRCSELYLSNAEDLISQANENDMAAPFPLNGFLWNHD